MNVTIFYMELIDYGDIGGLSKFYENDALLSLFGKHS